MYVRAPLVAFVVIAGLMAVLLLGLPWVPLLFPGLGSDLQPSEQLAFAQVFFGVATLAAATVFGIVAIHQLRVAQRAIALQAEASAAERRRRQQQVLGGLLTELRSNRVVAYRYEGRLRTTRPAPPTEFSVFTTRTFAAALAGPLWSLNLDQETVGAILTAYQAIDRLNSMASPVRWAVVTAAASIGTSLGAGVGAGLAAATGTGAGAVAVLALRAQANTSGAAAMTGQAIDRAITAIGSVLHTQEAAGEALPLPPGVTLESPREPSLIQRVLGNVVDRALRALNV